MTNENAKDPSSAARPGGERPLSMKERLLAERKAQGESSSAPEAASTSKPTPKPTPTTPPAARRPVDGNGTPSTNAVPRSTTSPVAKPAPRPAATPRPAAAAKPAATPAPGPKPTSTARPTSTRTPSRARATPEELGEAQHPDVKREINLLRQRESKTMMIAWIATGVLLVAAGITYVIVSGKKNAEQSAIEAQTALIRNFRTKAESFNVETKQGAEDLIKFLQEDKLDGQEVHWQQNDWLSGPMSTLLSRANATLQREVDKDFFFEQLTQAEAVAANAATKTPDEVVLARRKIKGLEDKAGNFGDDAVKRVANCRLQIEKVYLQRLWEDAKQQSTDAGTLRAGVTAFAKAENACIDLFEKKIPDPTGELAKFAGERRLQIYADSDEAVGKLFTPDYVNQQPWTDLLAGDMISQWQNDQVSGFQIKDGVLQVVGPEANSTKLGLISIPKGLQWRDFVIEGEIELAKGRTDFYVRLLKRPDAAVDGPRIEVGNDDNQVKPGRKLAFVLTCIGSKVSWTFPGGEGMTEKLDLPISPNRTRKGGFGASVPSGTEFKLTKLRIRILRPDVTG